MNLTREEKQEIRAELNVKKAKILELDRLKFDPSEEIPNKLKNQLRMEIIILEKKLECL